MVATILCAAVFHPDVIDRRENQNHRLKFAML
jgi:hypothetical protein